MTEWTDYLTEYCGVSEKVAKNLRFVSEVVMILLLAGILYLLLDSVKQAQYCALLWEAEANGSRGFIPIGLLVVRGLFFSSRA